MSGGRIATPADPAKRVIVFARVPRLGEVKTRLARSIGDAAALSVHRELMAGAMATAVTAGADRLELCVAGDDRDGECARLAASCGAALSVQRGDSLGDRMGEALGRALADGCRPVLIGCDVPSLTASDLRRAFDALEFHDAVFAPAEDGGYGLVGCRREIGVAFEAIPWGQPTVMAATRERLRAAGIGWAELRTVWDVDELEDLQRWRDR
jgi:rSAM/selenodomain-associated transferase 1